MSKQEQTNTELSDHPRPGLFWKVAFILILAHSSFLMMAFLGNTRDWAVRIPGYLQSLNPSTFELVSALDYMRACLGFPIIIMGSIIAIVLFACFRRGRCVLWLLFFYIGSQIILYGLMCAPDVHAHWVDIRSGMPLNWDIAGRFLSNLLACGLVTAPIFLLAGRYIFISLFGPAPPSDAMGRYITCTKCGYDLRGTPGPTCPECGASVMASTAGAPRTTE